MITCRECHSEDAILIEHEGGQGKTYYEFWMCNNCKRHWVEKYIKAELKAESEINYDLKLF